MPKKRNDEIYQHATLFRNAIEKTDPSKLPISFRNFPKGSCGDVVPLLGRFLKNQGFGSFDYISGSRGQNSDWHSHAWLQQDQLIVDITADQFREINESVIVTYKSTWHKTFVTRVLHKADYEIYDDQTFANLELVYNEIIKKINIKI